MPPTLQNALSLLAGTLCGAAISLGYIDEPTPCPEPPACAPVPDEAPPVEPVPVPVPALDVAPELAPVAAEPSPVTE